MAQVPESETSNTMIRHFRIVRNLTGVFVLYLAISQHSRCQREQRIAEAIRTVGGRVGFINLAPSWLSHNFGSQFFNRAANVSLRHCTVPSELLRELGALTHLELLDIYGTGATDADVKGYTGLTNLRYLCLANTNVTDSGLERFSKSKKIEMLDLRDTRITGDGLRYLKGMEGLRELNLRRTLVTDDGLDFLKPISSLRVVRARDTLVTSEGLQSLRNALPKCKVTPEE